MIIDYFLLAKDQNPRLLVFTKANPQRYNHTHVLHSAKMLNGNQENTKDTWGEITHADV